MAKAKAEKPVKVKKAPSVTFEQLQAHAGNGVGLTIGGTLAGVMQARKFSSGSYGLGYFGPVTLQLADGSIAQMQASISLVVKHSAPEAAATEEKAAA